LVAAIMGDGDANGTAGTVLTIVAIAGAATEGTTVADAWLKTDGLKGGANLRFAIGGDLSGAAGTYLTTEAPMIAGLGPRPVCSATPHPMDGEGIRILAGGDGGGEGSRTEPFRYD